MRLIAIVWGLCFALLVPETAFTQTPKKSQAEPKKDAPPKAKVVAFDKLDRSQLLPIDRDDAPAATVAVTVGEGVVLLLRFSADGKLATGNDKAEIVLYDLTGAAPKEITTVQLDKMKGHPERLRFSPDGKRLVARQGGTLLLWDITADGARPFVAQAVGRIEGLVFHPSGNRLVFGANVGQVADITSKGLFLQQAELRGANSSFHFSDDGDLFTSIFFNPQRNGALYGSEIMIWKWSKNRFIDYSMLRIGSGFKATDLSPDGKLIAGASLDGKVRVWDLEAKSPDPKLNLDSPGWMSHLFFAGESGYIVGFTTAKTSRREIVLWNLSTGKKEQSWKYAPKVEANNAMYSMSAAALGPDGKHLAVSSNTSKTYVLRLPVK